MANCSFLLQIKLTEDDIPGAKFQFGIIEDHSVHQLKRWLECRGLKTSGNKPELVERCKDALKSGRHNEIDESVDGGKWFTIKKEKHSQKIVKGPPVPPIIGWKTFPSRSIPENFNYGHIYHYLLESVPLQCNGDSSDDDNLGDMTAKPLRKGQQYVDSQSLSKIVDHGTSDDYYIKVDVDASMKQQTRHPVVTISSVSGAVLDAAFDCPANSLGRCSHVGALLLMLNKYCKENGHEPVASTSKPCAWKRGSKKSKDPKRKNDASYPSYQEKLINS